MGALEHDLFLCLLQPTLSSFFFWAQTWVLSLCFFFSPLAECFDEWSSPGFHGRRVHKTLRANIKSINKHCFDSGKMPGTKLEIAWMLPDPNPWNLHLSWPVLGGSWCLKRTFGFGFKNKLMQFWAWLLKNKNKNPVPVRVTASKIKTSQFWFWFQF